MNKTKLKDFLQGATDFYSAMKESWFNKSNVIQGLQAFLIFNKDPECETLAKNCIKIYEDFPDTPETFSKEMVLRAFDYDNKSERDSQLDLVNALRLKLSRLEENWFTKAHLMDFFSLYGSLNDHEEFFLETFLLSITLEDGFTKSNVLGWLDNISSILSESDVGLSDLSSGSQVHKQN